MPRPASATMDRITSGSASLPSAGAGSTATASATKRATSSGSASLPSFAGGSAATASATMDRITSGSASLPSAGAGSTATASATKRATSSGSASLPVLRRRQCRDRLGDHGPDHFRVGILAVRRRRQRRHRVGNCIADEPMDFGGLDILAVDKPSRPSLRAARRSASIRSIVAKRRSRSASRRRRSAIIASIRRALSLSIRPATAPSSAARDSSGDDASFTGVAGPEESEDIIAFSRFLPTDCRPRPRHPAWRPR